MKNQLLITGTLLVSVFATTAQADEILLGAGAGMTDYDLQNSDAGISGIFTVGYEFLDVGAADIGVEGELTLPLLDTEVNNTDAGFESLGAFATLRTTGPVYFIGRAGLVSGEIEAIDDTAPAAGIGIGFSSAGFRWEVKYTAYEVDFVDVDMISATLSF